jgi:hypothetical protein
MPVPPCRFRKFSRDNRGLAPIPRAEAAATKMDSKQFGAQPQNEERRTARLRIARHAAKQVPGTGNKQISPARDD